MDYQRSNIAFGKFANKILCTNLGTGRRGRLGKKPCGGSIEEETLNIGFADFLTLRALLPIGFLLMAEFKSILIVQNVVQLANLIFSLLREQGHS